MLVLKNLYYIYACSSKVVNNAATPTGRIRQATPRKTNEAALDKQRQTSSAAQ